MTSTGQLAHGAPRVWPSSSKPCMPKRTVSRDNFSFIDSQYANGAVSSSLLPASYSCFGRSVQNGNSFDMTKQGGSSDCFISNVSQDFAVGCPTSLKARRCWSSVFDYPQHCSGNRTNVSSDILSMECPASVDCFCSSKNGSAGSLSNFQLLQDSRGTRRKVFFATASSPTWFSQTRHVQSDDAYSRLWGSLSQSDVRNGSVSGVSPDAECFVFSATCAAGPCNPSHCAEQTIYRGAPPGLGGPPCLPASSTLETVPKTFLMPSRRPSTTLWSSMIPEASFFDSSGVYAGTDATSGFCNFSDSYDLDYVLNTSHCPVETHESGTLRPPTQLCPTACKTPGPLDFLTPSQSPRSFGANLTSDSLLLQRPANEQAMLPSDFEIVHQFLTPDGEPIAHDKVRCDFFETCLHDDSLYQLEREARRATGSRAVGCYVSEDATAASQSLAVAETTSPSMENPIRVEDIDEEQRFVLHLAILTLYKDQIKPYQVEIRHRLQELHGSPTLEKNFLLIYEALDSQYIVKRPGTSSAAVFLRETPSWFSGWVDMRDAHNPYPIRLWLAFYSYVITLLRSPRTATEHPTHCPDRLDPALLETRGGRYGMSKRLKTCGPPIFRQYSLGQVCHIVQLAVQLGILTYEGASLLPTASCRSMIRKLYSSSPEVLPSADRSSSRTLRKMSWEPAQDNASGQPEATLPVVTDLNEVLRNLETLLSSEEFQPMLLSQLKFRFLHKFKARLDPAVFGFARLSDFLTERCSACCRLVREGGRQVLVDRLVPPVEDQAPPHSSLSEPVKVDTAGVSEPVGAVDTKPRKDEKPSNEESDSLRMTRDLLALLSKHYRFHYNVTYSFWQYCAMSEQRASFPGRGAVPGAKCRTAEAKYSSVVWSPAATFTDLLFASVLRPASTEPFYSSAQNPLDRSSVFPEVCVLRWFTRQPLVERQLGQGEPLDEEDCRMLQDIFFGVLPPRLPTHDSSSNESAKGPRPSKLRRQITSQMAQLQKDIFSRSPPHPLDSLSSCLAANP